MAAKDMSTMYGALDKMGGAEAEPAEGKPADVPTDTVEPTGEVSEDELAFAEEMGFDAPKAAALKRFIRSCMQSEDEGEYEEPAAEEAPLDMGAMQ